MPDIRLERVYFENSQPILRVWIGVDDVTRLHEELKSRGVGICLPPTIRPCALEMQVEDPDGNVLRFGSEVR